MNASQFNLVFHNRCGLGEGPVWDADNHKLYWVDIDHHKVFHGDPATGTYQEYTFDVPITALGIRQKGGLIFATARGFAVWDQKSSAFQNLGEPEAGKPNARFNDGAVDRTGRFWAGTMTETDATSALYRLDMDHHIQRMEQGITISNGMGWSPDNRYFYFTDTNQRAIYRYDFNPVTGEIQNRTIFATVAPGQGVPDGLTVDQEGFIWSVRCGGGKIVRYNPNGKIDREIPTPVSSPTSITFGGDHLDELYVTTSASLINPALGLDDTQAGCTFQFYPDITGLPEPFYEG